MSDLACLRQKGKTVTFKDDWLVKYGRQVQNRVKGNNMKLKNKFLFIAIIMNHQAFKDN